MKIKEEARKREESDSKLQQQTSKANGAEEQKKQQERSDDKRVGAASAKKAKHVDKVGCYIVVLLEINVSMHMNHFQLFLKNVAKVSESVSLSFGMS